MWVFALSRLSALEEISTHAFWKIPLTLAILLGTLCPDQGEKYLVHSCLSVVFSYGICFYRQLVTSDSTASLFVGPLAVAMGAHIENTHGWGAEMFRAMGGRDVPMAYGTVCYRNGSVLVTDDRGVEHEIDYEKMHFYDPHYKAVRNLGIGKPALLRSPGSLNPRYNLDMHIAEAEYTSLYWDWSQGRSCKSRDVR